MVFAAPLEFPRIGVSMQVVGSSVVDNVDSANSTPSMICASLLISDNFFFGLIDDECTSFPSSMIANPVRVELTSIPMYESILIPLFVRVPFSIGL